jgi:4-alpha-glucanotransferase
MHLILCIHNHQPVGNMDFILEEAYARSYKPFFDVMEEFESIKINLHFSGYLLSWLNDNKPEYIGSLRRLVEKGRIEVVSGAMYEPILPLLSEDDGVSQIAMHMDFSEKVFGQRPKGMWLAERVYEPHLPKTMSKAGVSYTVVDDNHFKSVGLTDDELYGYFITEFDGDTLFIFPGLESLRYSIPFKPIEEIDAYFKGVEKKGGNLTVFGDDGEKFGLWPGTYDHVYGSGWLSNFFEYLEKNKSWLKTVTFDEYVSNNPPRARVYLNCNSYKEMAEWCLPPHSAKRFDACTKDPDIRYNEFLKGGYFKHFLVKYEESNDMHKKMLSISGKARKNDEARKHLFMGQCNDSYWHGVFGGLYLPHLRASVYQHLIEAEKLLQPEKPFVQSRTEDINKDGFEEVILDNNDLKACFLLKEGGVLYELDYKPSAVNIMATLQRRYEGYHDKIKAATIAGSTADGTKTIHDLVLAKEEGLDKYLHYDWYRRASLVDHVMGREATFESFYRSNYREPGDFVKEPYKGAISKEKDLIRLSMEREGHFWKDGRGMALKIRKEVLIGKGKKEIVTDYIIEGDVSAKFLFGVEFNFSLLGSGGDRYMEIEQGRLPLTTSDVLKPGRSVKLHDPYQQVDVFLEFDVPQAIWTHPVEVVSLSESGFERNYQSTMVMPVWELDLTGGPKHLQIKLRLSKA